MVCEVTLNHSSTVIGNSNDATNFPHKLLLTDTQVSRLCKTFLNGSAANVKLSKTQLSKTVQLVGFPGVFGVPDPVKIMNSLVTPALETYREELMKKMF